MSNHNRKQNIITMQGQLGRLRAGEKFYIGGKKLPYQVLDPFHRMGIKCFHPQLATFSYFNKDRCVKVDMRTAPTWFASRELATYKKK